MYSLSEYILAKYVHSSPYGSSAGNLKVYIPSLMPLITMGTPTITPVSLNKACYCNANDCNPSIGSNLNTQNFVTATSPYHPYNSPCYWFGKDLKIMAQTPDCLTCRLYSEEEDNSSPWPI